MAEKKRPLILTLDPVEPDEEPAAVAQSPSPAPGAALPSPDTAALRRPSPRRRVAKEGSAPAAAAPAIKASHSEAGPVLARWAYPAAWMAAALWAGCLVTFVLGYERQAPAFDYAPFRWTIIGGLALLPALLMLVFAYMVRQGARLADEARRARAFADGLIGPAALAGAHAGGAIGLMREEIVRVETAAADAAKRLTALHAALTDETRMVGAAAAEAERAASRFGDRLQAERSELGALSSTLDAQLAVAAEGAARHARLAADASDLAQANLQEAQAALAARTADLAAAAADAGRAAETAGSGLSGQTSRLERLTAELRREQRAWSDAAQALFADEEAAAARIETQRARFVAAAAAAREEAETLAAASADGSESLRLLIADAARQVNALADAARAQVAEGAAFATAQHGALEAEARAALERLAAATEAARDAAAKSARDIVADAAAAGEAAQLRIEAVAESAFAAGRQADQAFDSRLQAARRAIEAQAGLVEDAGLRSAARIEAGVEAVRSALGEAESLAAEVDRRFAEVRQAARVAPQPQPVADPEVRTRASALFERLNTPSADAKPTAAPAIASAAPTPAAPADAAATMTATVELRPRLRLATPEESLFAPEPAPPGATSRAGALEPSPAGEGWSWKDLLTTMNDGAPTLDDDALAEAMIGEIEAMGVDPGALLPRARIDEIARAVDAGDRARAREAVRRLAPAAVRRLSRRVLTDKVLRGQADLYRHRYNELLGGQAGGGGGGTSTLLGSDPGRAYLLLDAAVGDLH